MATTDALDQWANGLQQRVALQAEVIWPALQDGYSTAGGGDPARPFSQLWWQLQPVKTDHCADCPWVAYNSPYDPPGSGGNELAQSPGDGTTECGAACHCTLSYGGFDLPQDADWAQYMAPPDAPFVNAPANPGLIPSTVRQQGAGAYRPGRMPIGVSREGDYVYAGTPQEADLAAQRGVTPYGTISEARPGDEPFTVASIARDATALSTRQLQALDAFRGAWSQWNAVRGARPAARSLFGYVYDEQRGTFARPNATAGLLIPQRNPAGFATRQGPNGERFANSWDELTPRQQAALGGLYRAIAAWDQATQDAGAQLSEDGGGVTLTGGHEPGYSQNRNNKGQWGEGDGEEHAGGVGGGGSSEHEALVRETFRGGSIESTRKHATTGAQLSGKLRENAEKQLTADTADRDRIEAAIPKFDTWLSSHGKGEPGYDEISDRRMKAAAMHGNLQDRIEANQRALGQAVTARRILAPAPEGLKVAKAATARPKEIRDREYMRQKQAESRAQRREAQGLSPAERRPRVAGLTPEAAQARLERVGKINTEGQRQYRDRMREAVKAARTLSPEHLTPEQAHLAQRHDELLAAKRAKRAANTTQQLMEMADDLLRDVAIRLSEDIYAEDHVVSITLVGGHPQGYDQNRQAGGKWGPGDAHISYEDEGARQAVREIFGRELADHEMASLVGARGGDAVHVERLGAGHIHLQVTGEHLSWNASREVRKMSNDMVIMRNNNIRVLSQGQGLGAEILARQVSGASRLGVSRIDTSAARSSSMNGYDTWAKLGYDGHIPGGVRTDFGDQIRSLAPHGTIQELMRITEPVIRLSNGRMVNGQELWKMRGDTWHGEFDLTPGSHNRQVLRAYLEAKGRKPLADELQLKAPADSTEPHGEEIEWTPDDDAIALKVWRELDAKWKREEAAVQGHKDALDD